MFSYQPKNFKTCKETENCDQNTGEKTGPTNHLQSSPDVGLSRKRHGSDYYKSVQRKETMIKELKEIMMTMTHQVVNIKR